MYLVFLTRVNLDQSVHLLSTCKVVGIIVTMEEVIQPNYYSQYYKDYTSVCHF